jgi:hypothetical protein
MYDLIDRWAVLPASIVRKSELTLLLLLSIIKKIEGTSKIEGSERSKNEAIHSLKQYSPHWIKQPRSEEFYRSELSNGWLWDKMKQRHG